MKRPYLLGMLTLVAAALVVVSGCGGGEEGEGGEPAAAAGGTYRVDWETAFDFQDAFDPTGEYTAHAAGLYANLLLRTLIGYRHTVGEAGNEPLPDLAEAMPEVSADGLTYTFKIKQGVMFGEPVNREIVSQDIVYALERLATPDLSAPGYPFYYDVIDGFSAFGAGEADTITGIETPDDKTLVFHLTEPTGDFVYRMSMGATAPIPEEVAKCFTAAGDYGRYVISSGPYQLEGSENLDITSCETMEPISGYDPERFMNFVRNPNYDPATDSPEQRESLPDRFEFTINSNNDDIFNKVKAGLIDDTFAGERPKVLREYTETEDLQDNLKRFADDSIFYVSLNLVQPPFDDVHVRRAVNFVLDKGAMIQALGGPVVGDVATHFIPASLTPGLEGYDPYPSADFAGDVEAAMEEMKLSAYDTDKDGLCDAPECTDVFNITGNEARDRAIQPIVEDSFAKIGVMVKTQNVDSAFAVISDPTKQVAMSTAPGWGKDYADGSTYFSLFLGSGIVPPGATSNFELVGITKEKADEYGIPFPEGGVPSIDADYDACGALAGAERATCWETLDKKITEEVVPTVPWFWRSQTVVISDAVTQWDFDQFWGGQAWAHVAVDPSKQS